MPEVAFRRRVPRQGNLPGTDEFQPGLRLYTVKAVKSLWEEEPYVSSMHRKRSCDGRRSGVYGRISAGWYREVSEVSQGGGSRCGPENKGELTWQRTKRKGL